MKKNVIHMLVNQSQKTWQLDTYKVHMFIFSLALQLTILLGIISPPLRAQDIPNLQRIENVEEVHLKEDFKDFFKGFKEAKPFDISGSFGLSMRSYNAHNIENRQSPFMWLLNGNVNLSIYKIKIPFSVLLSSQTQTYSHPFNQELVDNFLDRRYTRIGASPYYKWVKLHAGHRSMNFSPLTVANRTFLGGGLELTPGKLRFAAFYGGMPKTDPQDRALFGFNNEIFDQKGLGFKLGYGDDQSFIDLIIFKARDEYASNTSINQDSAYVFPIENAVLGINGKYRLLENVLLEFELATSAFNQSGNDPTEEGKHILFPKLLINNRNSTSYRDAISTSITHYGDHLSLGLGYKRIEPEYKTLGAYFFNSDLEDFSINAKFGIFKKRLRVSTTLGVQRNNLFNDKSNQFTRTILGINAGYYQNKYSIVADYSNYTSDLDYVLNLDLDSLRAIIITQSSSITFNQSSAATATGNRHNYMVNLSLQKVNDKLENPGNLDGNSQMINAVFNYTFAHKKSGLRLNTMANYTHSEFNQIDVDRYGLGVGVQKTMIKDLWFVSLNTNYFVSKGMNINNQTINVRLSSPFRVSKHHRIDFGTLFIGRTKAGFNKKNFYELIGTLNYTYTL